MLAVLISLFLTFFIHSWALAKKVAMTLLLTGLCLFSYANAESLGDGSLQSENTEQASAQVGSTITATMPAVEVVAENSTDPKAFDQCQTSLVNQDIESRYKKIQDALEADYAQGLPKQLKTDLIRVRQDIDGLIGKLFDVDNSNSQEVNHIAQLTIDYLEKMISLVPKAHRIAPVLRDRYVVPFTNISSIKAEHQDCLMKAAVEEVKADKTLVASNESSINIYKKLTTELERLNNNLYKLQTSDVQRFISYRAKILEKLEDYNKNQGSAVAITNDIPQILNNVHREIETLIPGLELSKEYLTFAH